MDRATSALLIACILGYFLFVIAVFFTTPPIQQNTRLVEPPIAKNSQLMLQPGESYLYEVLSPQERQVVQYSISSCKGIQISESPTGTQVCVSRSGNLLDEDNPSNFSYGNRSLLLFGPWMLAVTNSSDWVIQTMVSAGGMEIPLSTRLISRGEKYIGGRRAYEVGVDSEIGGQATMYVDLEKRVLVYADYGNLTARLVRAPFGLNWAGTTQN